MSQPTVLVIEDGNEYLNVLSRFISGYKYLQAHDGRSALTFLEQGVAALVYLDMRFDRTPRHLLLGDHAQQTSKFGGDTERAWQFLEKNQGLFILNHLSVMGYTSIPVVLSHDFSNQPARWKHLSTTYPNLSWLPDTVTPENIHEHFTSVLAYRQII